MIVRTKFLNKSNIIGITIYPFIFIRENYLDDASVLINHEKIHLEQQKELLILPFFIWYGVEYLIRRIKGESKNNSYLNLLFEQEAYLNENNENYLKTRKRYNYFKKRKTTNG